MTQEAVSQTTPATDDDVEMQTTTTDAQITAPNQTEPSPTAIEVQPPLAPAIPESDLSRLFIGAVVNVRDSFGVARPAIVTEIHDLEQGAINAMCIRDSTNDTTKTQGGGLAYQVLHNKLGEELADLFFPVISHLRWCTNLVPETAANIAGASGFAPYAAWHWPELGAPTRLALATRVESANAPELLANA